MTQKIRMNKSLGENLRRIRTEKNLTQEQVIARLQLMNIDISRSIYSQIECGTYNIKVSTLIALKFIFSVSYDEFFEGIKIVEEK